MARIRTIKPEFWTNEKVMECSPVARLLFIGMWNYADDAGRMGYSAKTLKAQIFPADDMDFETIRRMVVELSSNGLLHTYVVDGKEYIQITGWHHQKIDKPRKSDLPEPLPECSSNDRRTFAAVSNLTLVEGKGEDAAPPARVAADAEKELFQRGREILGPNTGGLVKRLLDAKGGNIALARAAIETASTKGDPREYVAAMLKGIGKRAKENETCPPEIYDLLVK
jgi:hypothetical protein